MKNIHVLPTDKPTRLFTSDSDLVLAGYPATEFKTGKNIYITSDESIKVGDYSYEMRNIIDKIDESYDLEVMNAIASKIILTTDVELIADGIQAIPEEFLEWFVKNQSCPNVNVEKQYITPLGDVVATCYDNERLTYKIIIPKEDYSPQVVYLEKDMREMYDKSCGLIGLGQLQDQTENDNRFKELLEQINKK